MPNKRISTTLLCLLIALFAAAQSTEKLYREGKALYDQKQYEKAVAKLKPAADKGHDKAQYRLARCYEKGQGVEEDEAKAYALYLKSAQQGNDKAQYRLGRCYKKGNGTQKSYQKAALWFGKSAQQDNADAQYALAKCYLKGQGVNVDSNKAKSLLKKATSDAKHGKEILAEIREDANAGDETAKTMLTLLGKK